MIDACSRLMWENGYGVYAKFSAIPLFKARLKSKRWEYLGTVRDHKVVLGGNMTRDTGFRVDVSSHQFKYIPEEEDGCRKEKQTDSFKTHTG